MLDSIDDRESWLTEWERGFCDSIREKYRLYGRLTPKQQSTLEKIYRKVA